MRVRLLIPILVAPLALAACGGSSTVVRTVTAGPPSTATTASTGAPAAPVATTTPPTTAAAAAPATSAAPAAPTTFTMPNEVGKVLQAAQDDIQVVSNNPLYYTSSSDATGAGRS